jgi:hypothetical protein
MSWQAAHLVILGNYNGNAKINHLTDHAGSLSLISMDWGDAAAIFGE